MSRHVTIEAHLVTDFPKETETIVSQQYSIRFSASNETDMVEVSIDGGPYQPCRRANGNFWFDWSNFMSGRHTIQARARLHDGQFEYAPVRQVKVELGQTR